MSAMMPEGLDALQEAIQILHQLMGVLPDAKDTQVVAKCLQALTGIQQEMMNNRPQSAAQTLVQQLAGGGAMGGGGGGGY